MLEKKFKTLCQNFSKDKKLIAQLWEEIKTTHSEKSRYYHTLKHLEHIYKELESFELSPLVEFSIFYHDLVYDVRQNNNEEVSALYGMICLNYLGANRKFRNKLLALILATKTHISHSNEDKLFLDADLSILGSDEKSYKHYIQNVRKEYIIYDDITYFKGRKKVLKSFLEKEKIYESKHFYDKYEKQARVNMLIEYNSII